MPRENQPTEEGRNRGRRGEAQLRVELNAAERCGEINLHLQPDSLVFARGGLYMVESKSQDHFVAPPFDGHGVQVWEVERYMRALELVGLQTMVVVYDGPRRFREWLHVLEAGPHFDTNGAVKGEPRRIYPLTSYREDRWQ